MVIAMAAVLAAWSLALVAFAVIRDVDTRRADADLTRDERARWVAMGNTVHHEATR